MNYNVTLDIEAISFPAGNISNKDVVGHVEKVLEWSKLLGMNRVNASLNCDGPWGDWEMLIELKLTPDEIKELLTKMGIMGRPYHMNDVLHLIHKLLSFPFLEESEKIEQVDLSDYSTNPNINSSLPERHKYVAERCALVIAVLGKFNSSKYLYLRDQPVEEVKVQAKINKFVHNNESIDEVELAPKTFSGLIRTIHDMDSFISFIDEVALFKDMKNEDDLRFAVRIALQKNANEDEKADFKFGPKFFKSILVLEKRGDLPEKILRAIIETIYGRNLRATHDLREKPSGGSPQKTRKCDDAKAWRRNIDDEYRLHYWKKTNNFIELASVNNHEDYTIPE